MKEELKEIGFQIADAICHWLDLIPTVERDGRDNKIHFFRAGSWGCRFDVIDRYMKWTNYDPFDIKHDTFFKTAQVVFVGEEEGGFCPKGGWWGGVWVDQWWKLKIECDHGAWTGTSHGPFDITTALKSAISQALMAHDEIKENDEHRHAEAGSDIQSDQSNAGQPGQG